VNSSDGADELHDDDGFSRPGAAENPGLAAFGERGDQVDHFQAGLEYLDPRRLFFERGGRAVDRVALFYFYRALAIHRFAEDIEDAPQGGLPDGDHNGRAGALR